MDKPTAVKIIRQLADGIDPHTGEAFDAGSAYQHPDTVRALFFALGALEGPATKPRPEREAALQNAGKPWPEDEDKALVAKFDAGVKIPTLSEQHQRSCFAIETRLAKLGKIDPPPNMRGGTKAKSPQVIYLTQ